MDKQRSDQTSFEFINVTGGSGHERRRNNYLARAHAAKINRQNYKTQQADSRRSSKHLTTLSILPRASSDSTSRTSGSEDDYPDGHIERSGSRTAHSDAESGRISQDGTPERSVLHAMSGDTMLPTPRSMSPAYGALAVDTFDWTSQPISSQVGHYLLKVSWPARSGTKVTRAWWTLFCKSPIIFHVSHLASAVHRDLMVGEDSWSSSREILMHKTKTIQLVNEQLARLDTLDPETVDRLIFAVCTLSRHEMETKHLQSGEVLLFTPHLPHANGMKPLGRLNLSESARTLLVQLVNRQGGLDKLQILGLGEILALIDILESSTNISKPRFPLFWEVPELADFEGFAGIGHVSPGRGFLNLSGILTTQAATAFRSLAHADKILGYYGLVPLDQDFNTVLYIRNSAIHAALSLPAWQELSVSDGVDTDPDLYEACRITAIIYSNAVLLGLPTHSGWHRSFVGKLRDLLEATSRSALAKFAPRLVTWILYVASIASYRTPHRRFFESCLRDLLLFTGMTSWHSVKQCLEEFLWSEGCEHGAAVIWDAMDLENTWPC